MTIAETTSQTRNTYPGNGITTVYSFTFIVLQESNQALNKDYTIKVIITEGGIDSVKQENTDYTVQLGTNGLGTVTFTTAPTATQTITFLSEIPRTQSTDYINLGTDKFPANSHEGTVDKLTLINREQDEAFNRSILLPESSTLTNVTIPVNATNKDKAIVVNSTGDNLDAKNLADIGTAPVTDFAKTLLDDNSSSEARTTLNIYSKEEVNIKINNRVTVSNVNYTILATDKVVAQTGTMSAARTFSLPAASTVEAGAEIIIIDESGTVTSTNKIIVQRNGTDTIDGQTSVDMVKGYGVIKLICDGSDSWKIINFDNAPAFHYTLSSNQNIGNGIFTKVQIDNKILDTNNYFDNVTNYRFTPLIPGWYNFSFGCSFIDAFVAPQSGQVSLYKNGSVIRAAASRYYDNGGDIINSNFISYMNGTTDYIELYAIIAGASANSIFGNFDTYLSGFKLNI